MSRFDPIPMLPEAWVSRIFSRLEGLYGSRFHAAWVGTDMPNVKATWAERLAGFSDKPEAIKAALDALDNQPFPPTLPEFLILCREAARRVQPAMLALDHKLSPEEIEHNRERLAKIQRDLAAKMSGGQP